MQVVIVSFDLPLAQVLFLATNAYVQGLILNVDGGVLNELSS